MQLPKLKVKVYFYHLFMLSVVMLLCFYLVYRDMKRVENNVLGMYNRIGKLEKFNDNFYPKMNELLKNSEAVNNPQNQYMNQNIEAFENIETLQESSNTEQDTINEVDNIMKNVINLNENVLEQQQKDVDEVVEESQEYPKVEQVEVVEVVEESPKVEEVEGLVEEVDEDDNEDYNEHDNVVDGVMDLVNSIESKDNRDLLELDEKELLEKTNTELKDYLKNKGLANTGNKKKLVETILNLKKK